MIYPEEIRASKWVVAPPVPESTRDMMSGIPPALLQVLYNRGVSRPAQIQAFLDGFYLESTDPFLLADMDKAVARIQQAIEQDEMVVVYGDFDADGVTATVLLTEALRGLGMHRQQAQPYIPDRVDEGYGLNEEALTALKEKGADLVITVDCGIRSVKEVEHANEIGLDMIVTDHHSLGSRLPPATAVINPKRPESAYPEEMLAGVGIAFKLAQALRQTMPQRARYDDSDLLDLVAIGTVADLAPLLGENRKLVREGLAVLNAARRPGINALRQIASLNGLVTAETIGFGIGPRINAAGRLAHAYTAAKLLAVTNEPQAFALARELNGLNRQRQQLTAELSALAEGMIETTDDPILIAADSGFLPGIVGLVASRLSDNYYRPAIVIEKGNDESRGSCRSIPEFHITEALDEVESLLERYGGHAQAAGFTVKNKNLPAFIERIREVARRRLAGKELAPSLSIDMEMDLDAIDWALFESLAHLEPTGYANPAPVFMSRNVEVLGHRVVGQNGSHLQLTLANAERHGSYYNQLPAIAFRQAAWAQRLPQMIDVVYTINVNEWRGQRNLQLMVQELRPSTA